MSAQRNSSVWMLIFPSCLALLALLSSSRLFFRVRLHHLISSSVSVQANGILRLCIMDSIQIKNRHDIRTTPPMPS